LFVGGRPDPYKYLRIQILEAQKLGSGTLVISIIYLTPQVENFDRMAS
jgi:hypothetical protein